MRAQRPHAALELAPDDAEVRFNVGTALLRWWSVGLVLNQFIFDNSTLTAKLGSYTGTNVAATGAPGVQMAMADAARVGELAGTAVELEPKGPKPSAGLQAEQLGQCNFA